MGAKKDLLQLPQPGSPQQTLPPIGREEVKQLVEKYRFTFKFETSAKDNHNIDLVFEELSRNLIYNNLQRKKAASPLKEDEWSVILQREQQTTQQSAGNCC